MSKETELSDKAIKDMHQYHYGVERYLKFARAIIAADRELRQGDEIAVLKAERDALRKDAAADPLQGAADWLVSAHSGIEISTLAGKLSIGHNRAKRLYDAAIARRRRMTHNGKGCNGKK